MPWNVYFRLYIQPASERSNELSDCDRNKHIISFILDGNLPWSRGSLPWWHLISQFPGENVSGNSFALVDLWCLLDSCRQRICVFSSLLFPFSNLLIFLHLFSDCGPFTSKAVSPQKKKHVERRSLFVLHSKLHNVEYIWSTNILLSIAPLPRYWEVWADPHTGKSRWYLSLARD